MITRYINTFDRQSIEAYAWSENRLESLVIPGEGTQSGLPRCTRKYRVLLLLYESIDVYIKK